jgi:hypothetical protein
MIDLHFYNKTWSPLCTYVCTACNTNACLMFGKSARSLRSIEGTSTDAENSQRCHWPKVITTLTMECKRRRGSSVEFLIR